MRKVISRERIISSHQDKIYIVRSTATHFTLLDLVLGKIVNMYFHEYSSEYVLCESVYSLDSLALRGILGDRHLGGVRHFSISSSALVLVGTGSATSSLSVLPSSTPLPNHRPHGNLVRYKYIY